jgi:hypothetical protein
MIQKRKKDWGIQTSANIEVRDPVGDEFEHDRVKYRD